MVNSHRERGARRADYGAQRNPIWAVLLLVLPRTRHFALKLASSRVWSYSSLQVHLRGRPPDATCAARAARNAGRAWHRATHLLEQNTDIRVMRAAGIVTLLFSDATSGDPKLHRRTACAVTRLSAVVIAVTASRCSGPRQRPALNSARKKDPTKRNRILTI